ncbi:MULTISPECIES: transposase [Bacillaceae]|uniref:transposase n=1 Tax=Bacillaceae TaxID=186817 RepID=UPI0006BDFB37|nr:MULTISPECIES: transposase [Bacillaceae]ALC84644.1 transposase [Bacillus sp. FJAT-22090]KQL32537.1 transposase [Psychrobacillus sp. FJAT-21963]MDF2067963.1 transposase [Bacillus sp. Cr_A10]
MDLKKVYVSVSHRKVYIYPDESPWEYEIVADREIIPVFQKLFEQLSDAEMSNFWRAHIPIRLYHLDKENDEYDIRMKKLYALIHEFSNEESRSLIESLPYFNESRRVFVE